MKNILSALFLMLSVGAARAQLASVPDTLAYARAKADEKDFGEADRILTLYNAAKRSADGLRLQAQVLYLKKDLKRAAALHEQAIAAFPNLPVLQLDYARLLVEMSELDKAKGLLVNYQAPDSLLVEPVTLLALIDYKQLRLGAARQGLAGVLARYPGNATAMALLHDIRQTTVPYFRAGSRYLSDDQPLRALTHEAEVAWFRSWLLAPTVQFQANYFTLPEDRYQSYWLQVSNRFTFQRLGLTLNATGGLFQLPGASRRLVGTGTLLLSQTLSKSLAVDASVGRQPYQAVLTGVREPVPERLAGAALRYSRAGKWLGKAGYERRTYGDDNAVHSAYAWLLAPLVTSKTLALKAGYSLSYANATYSTYSPMQALGDVVANGGAVTGSYAPYFTPNNQLINALLLSAKLTALKNVAVTARGSYGVAGRADAPYLFLNKTAANVMFIDRGFARQDYHPVEVLGEIVLQASPALAVAATYSYASLIYYTRHQFELQLRYHLIREKH